MLRANRLSGDALNVGPHDAEVGEFAVGQCAQLRHVAIISLPVGDAGFENFEHGDLLRFGVDLSCLQRVI